jgi:ABC-2 type transport system permease protein
MNTLPDTLWIETRKAIRSRMPLFTTLGYMIMPLATAFMIFVSKNPQLAQKLGLISAKASLLGGTADWPGYLKLMNEATAAGGFFLFCLITSWVFGREFVDGTVKDLLAVPVSRWSILMAKFLVVAGWSALITLVVTAVAFVMGAVIGLPQGSTSVILQGSGVLAVSACLTLLIVLPFAFLASLGRGYLLPLGMAVLAMILANLSGVAGWGDYFPWAVPGLYAQGSALAPVSFGIVVVTGLLGVLATYVWWKFADQNR